MKSNFVHWCEFFFVVFLLGGGSAYAAEFTEEFNRTYPLKAGAPVQVKNTNGKVEISAWDQNYAEVRAVKRTRKDRSELAKVTIEVNTGNGLSIHTVFQKGNAEEEGFVSHMLGSVRTSPQVSVDYTIRLPRTAQLSWAETVNGSVILRETQGVTVASTTNGTVSAENVARIERAETTNGNIDLTGGAVASAKTVNGSISVTVTAANPENMSFSTVNGSVSVVLPSAINANVDLRTVNGRVSVPDGLTLGQGTISARKVSGRLGSGGRNISAETINGSISLMSGRR